MTHFSANSPHARDIASVLHPQTNARKHDHALDPALDPGEIATTMREGVEIDGVLSNSFGFGGTNATLVMSKFLG